METLNDYMPLSNDWNNERLQILKQQFPDWFTSEGNLNIDEVKKAVEALEEVCERVGVNYAVFFSEQPHSITGGATFTIEEYAILIETFSRRLPLEQVRFLRKVMDMIITDRSSSSWPVN